MSILGSPRIWAAVISFAAAQPALAAAPASVFPDLHVQRTAPPAPAGSEVIISTYIHNSGGYSGIAEPAGAFTQIDSQVVTCPKSDASCTFTVTANVQATGGANASNEWAICPIVDSTYIDNCPFIGELPADGNYGTGNVLQSISVAPGKHTVSVQVVSYDGATVGYYQIQYSAYKP
jgi:hypothetical protein